MKDLKMTEKAIKSRQDFLAAILSEYGIIDTIDRAQIKNIWTKYKLSWPTFLVADKKLRAGRGIFYVPTLSPDGEVIYPDGKIEVVPVKKTTKKTVEKAPKTTKVPDAPAAVETVVNADKISSTAVNQAYSFVPSLNKNYVAWGESGTLTKILKSNLFFPTFITGLSGNGKTFMVEQTAAKLKRELIRTNLTIETDEDDLIGGFRLIDGNTVWHNGPVIEAMLRGAILLLDEIDLASNKIMCLQPILEGSGIYIKKIGKFVQPAPGFNIIATANTKGKGSDSGMFIGTNILNEAFLERFCITIEQNYPSTNIENKILTKTISSLKDADLVEEETSFITNLIAWANSIRDSFKDGIVDDIITTRRLIHILKLYTILGNKKKAITFGIARFDEEVQGSFLDLYSKIDDLFVEKTAEDTPEEETFPW